MNYDELKPVFSGKRAVILGFGREGQSWLEILKKLDVCREIAVADMNKTEIENVKVISGEDYLEKCAEYDIILQSPGVVIKNRLDSAAKAKILTQTELLLRLHPCKIIGITGTKGKSTTSSLVHHFLQACGKKTMLIGNIGVPPLKRLEEMDEETVAVLEMSCHQLEFARHSPDISVLLNIFPEHLDHYVDFQAYAEAKRNIARFQNKDGVLIVNRELLPVETSAKVITAGLDDKNADVCALGGDIYLFGKKIEKINSPLCGKHNVYNVAAALAAAISAGADLNKCFSALGSFKPLEHRLERFAVINGVEFINDSISTVPEAAIAAVRAFDGVDCLILGGMDRGISYDILGEFLNGGTVKNVILLPDTSARIAKLITNESVNTVSANDLKEAVELSFALAKKRVVLSPAAASYGFYKNFEERGKHFKQLVNSHKNTG